VRWKGAGIEGLGAGGIEKGKLKAVTEKCWATGKGLVFAPGVGCLVGSKPTCPSQGSKGREKKKGRTRGPVGKQEVLRGKHRRYGGVGGTANG